MIDLSTSVPPPYTPGWWLSVYPSALEAGGSFQYSWSPPRVIVPGQPAADPERARTEAARRARTRARRYCAANRLSRFGTLTYRGEGCHDPKVLRADIGAFFRALRAALGGAPLPYLWVPEWHKSHGLHVHFAVGQFVPRGLIQSAWGRGFIKIKLLSDMPVGSGDVEAARRAAGYLSKYVGKAFDGPKVGGLHRFDVAQGFQPKRVRVYARTVEEVVEQASLVAGRGDPDRLWRSVDQAEWQGPPAVWVSWRG